MMAAVFIEQHERSEAIEAYKNRLTSEQIDAILEAPDTALIELRFGINRPGTEVMVIEEG